MPRKKHIVRETGLQWFIITIAKACKTNHCTEVYLYFLFLWHFNHAHRLSCFLGFFKPRFKWARIGIPVRKQGHQYRFHRLNLGSWFHGCNWEYKGVRGLSCHWVHLRYSPFIICFICPQPCSNWDTQWRRTSFELTWPWFEKNYETLTHKYCSFKCWLTKDRAWYYYWEELHFFWRGGLQFFKNLMDSESRKDLGKRL